MARGDFKIGVRVRARTRMRGLGLIELLVALVVSGIIVAGVVYVYDQSRRTYTTNETVARVQEQARFVFSFIEAELQLAGGYGLTNNAGAVMLRSSLVSDDVGVEHLRQVAAVPAALIPLAAHACGRNFAVDLMLAVQGSNDEFALGPNSTDACEPQGGGYLAGTDTLTVRRASTLRESALAGNQLQLYVNRLAASADRILVGIPEPPEALRPGVTEVRNLVVRTFYVSQDSDGRPGVPALRMKRLRELDHPAGAFEDEELAAGVEDLQVQFGVDTGSYDGDDAPDFPIGGDEIPETNGFTTRYVDPDDPLVDPLLPNVGQVVSVRIWLRVRGDAREQGFVDTRRYDYAGVSYTPDAEAAHFRRLLISRTIQLRNSRQ
jgi:type IV pilus assembly protein PilW